MSRLSIVVCALVLLVVAAGSVAADEMNSDKILALEAQRIQATIGTDAAALDRLLAEDLFFAHSNGTVNTKQQLIKAITEKVYEYKQVDTEESSARVFGKAAVVNAVATFTVVSNEYEIKQRLRYTAVYAERDGRWQLVSYQSTRLARLN